MRKHTRNTAFLRISTPLLIQIAISCLFLPLAATAQIRTDGSVGAVQQISTLNVPGVYAIPQNLGRLSGNNLFHSFSDFNINAGQSANFITITSGLSNVISRVTGGQASSINGALTLTSMDGTPAFWFINPTGVVFGAGASVQVPGAFHVTTANYLKFANGNFYASPTQTSTFSSAEPVAFGFLGGTSAPIEIHGGAVLNSVDKSFSAVAGDITISNGKIASDLGDIRIVAFGAQAGTVTVTGPLPVAQGNVNIQSGGLIESSARGANSGGAILIAAGSLTIDTMGSSLDTGIFSRVSNGTGDAGFVRIDTTGDVSVLNGGSIESSTYGGSTGSAGGINISAGGNVLVDSSGRINSDSNGSGNAGIISVSAKGDVTVSNSGNITSDTVDSGNAGSITISAVRNLTISSAGAISSTSNGVGNAGRITLNSMNDVSVLNEGSIDSSTYAGSTGNAGGINISAGGNVLVDSDGRINSDTNGSGNAGDISISAKGDVTVSNSGNITSDTVDSGNAGSITISAERNLTIFSAGAISSTSNGDGNAGQIILNVMNDVSLLNEGSIDSSTYGGSTGSAGGINISAGGNVLLDGKGRINSDTNGSGNAGDIGVSASGDITVSKSGNITSDTVDSGNAGSVIISAGRNLTISYEGYISSSTTDKGDAGTIVVNVNENLKIQDGGHIFADSDGAGLGGTVTVTAGNLTIDGRGTPESLTGISSVAGFLGGVDSYGDAGAVTVMVMGLMTIQWGEVSSSTYAEGRAGSVSVRADKLVIDGSRSSISASARAGSAGQTGVVSVNAIDTLIIQNGGEIAIGNDATVTSPGLLTSTRVNVSAANVTMRSSGNITSKSTGNVSASDIAVNVDKLIWLDQSAITASAVNGNGGSIAIQGGDLLRLNRSLITTSVTGTSGNGGSISLTGKATIMANGFIQANTVADLASGGTVDIGVETLIASNNTLLLGGSTPYAFKTSPRFNVIQAASPTGINGTVSLSSPSLDVAGSLVMLKAGALQNGGFGRSPCATSGGSSFAQTGRGGLPTSSFGLLRAETAQTKLPTPSADTMILKVGKNTRSGCGAG